MECAGRSAGGGGTRVAHRAELIEVLDLLLASSGEHASIRQEPGQGVVPGVKRLLSHVVEAPGVTRAEHLRRAEALGALLRHAIEVGGNPVVRIIILPEATNDEHRAVQEKDCVGILSGLVHGEPDRGP